MYRTTARRAGMSLVMPLLAAAMTISAAPAANAAILPVAECSRIGATTLREGQSGAAVRNLQVCLVRLGMVVLGITGTFDDNTKHAVITAQKLAGLTRDGLVGLRTRSWLRAARPVLMPAAPQNKPRTAVVDIARQVMFISMWGRTRVIDISSGSDKQYLNPLDGTPRRASTPRGYFLINRHVVGEHLSSAGLGTMYSPSYFDLKGHAVHGSNSVPVYPASHGCIRVTRALETHVQNALRIGTHIYIF